MSSEGIWMPLSRPHCGSPRADFPEHIAPRPHVASLFLAFGAGDPPRWKHLMAVSVGAGVIDQCERLAETVFAAFGAHLPTEAGVLPWTALALTGGVSSYAGVLLLTSLNMFTLWTVGAVGWALSVLCSTSKIKAVLIAAAVWTVSAGCTIVLLHLLRNAYALSPDAELRCQARASGRKARPRRTRRSLKRKTYGRKVEI